MLLSLILTGLLAGEAQLTPPPTHAAATELARNGEHEEALVAFRRIAAANPDDHDARIWIARLHMRMGNPELAEAVYRSLLVEHPARVDAMVGLGQTLAELGRADEALEILERAESASPDNPDLIAALGHAHRDAGHTTRSLYYMERAVMLSPTRQNKDALERIRLMHGHRLVSNNFLESFTLPVSDTRSSDLTVNVRLNDAFRVFGRGQVQRKFGERDARGGLGAEWRWRSDTTFGAHVLVGPDNLVLPEWDANLQVAHTRRDTELMFAYRFFDFAIGDAWVLSPAVTWWARDDLSFSLRYALTLTNFNIGGERTETHSARLDGAYRFYPRVWATLGYARGVENFENFSPDRLGDFRANTVSGGVRIDMPTLTSLFGVYEHQWRRNDVEMNRFTVGLAQGF